MHTMRIRLTRARASPASAPSLSTTSALPSPAFSFLLLPSPSKFVDDQRSWGYTLKPRAKFVVLPHVHVARSCPILKHGATPPPASDTEPHTHTHAQTVHGLPVAFRAQGAHH